MDRDTLRVIHTGDPIAPIYRAIIGDAARIHIPLRDADQHQRHADQRDLCQPGAGEVPEHHATSAFA